MEPWQRIGTYAAGLALDSAGVKGKAGIPLAHGHDRRGRRRRARRAGRSQRGGERRQGREGGSLRQRAADERPAPDPLPRAAFKSSGRQHLDRARRHRLVAHLHGRGVRGRRSRARRACAHPGEPERPCAGRRRLQCRALGSDAAFRARAASRARRAEARMGAQAAWSSAPSGRFWCWRKRRMRRRAAQSRSRASRRSRRITSSARLAP